MKKENKEVIVVVLVITIIIPIFMFGFYLIFGFIDWLVGDPLEIINNCLNCR